MSITLRFHRAGRPARPVGTLKNGAGLYWLTTCNGEKVYLVRRKAKSETAKGYGQATEVTLAQLETATITDDDARVQAALLFRQAGKSLEAHIRYLRRRVEEDGQVLAELIDAGPEGAPYGNGNRRLASVPCIQADQASVWVEWEHRWSEEYLQTRCQWTGKLQSETKVAGWELWSGSEFYLPAILDVEVPKATREAARWYAAADALA